MAISNRFQGYPAFNNKDIVPTGYIDSIVSRQFPDNEPKGTYSVESITPMVTVYGKSVHRGLVKYKAVEEDLAGTNNQEDPLDPYRYKKYFIFVDYEYFDIHGVALGKYNTVKFVVHIVEDLARKKLDSLTEKWILPEEVAEYIIIPTVVSGIKEEDIPNVIGVDYFSIYFTSKRERLLPASTLGININYFYNLALTYPDSGSDFTMPGIGGLIIDPFVPSGASTISSPVIYKWGLQLMNAKTVVNKEIAITQSIIDSKGTIGGLQYFHIPLEQSDQGIYKILCVSKKKVDFSDSDLKVLGKGFIPPGDSSSPGSDPTDPRDGIDSQKLTDAEPFAFGICQNRELKKKYKSGSSNRDFPQSEIQGISLQGYMINSPLFVFNEDSVTDGFYLVTTNANPIELGKSIYITYGLVENHELRHVAQSRAIYLGATPMSNPSPAQYEFKKFKFRVLKTHLEKNIFQKWITSFIVPGSTAFTPGEISIDFSKRVNTNFTANHSNYISDINGLKLPEESRPLQLLDNFYSYRITRSKVASVFFKTENPINGYYVANAIGVIDSGGNIYAPGIYHIDTWGQPKLLFPASSIRNQKWWKDSFSNSGYYNISSAMQPSLREFLYDVGDFANSYIPDDRKIPYDRKFGLALSELSKASRLDPRVATSGVGICCLDFINLNALNSRVNGSSVLFNPASIPDDFNLINIGYIDLSEAEFDTSTVTDMHWSWDALSGTPGNPAVLNANLGYFFYKPINFNKNGRIFWEGIGPGNQTLLMINVLTTPVSSYFSGSFETTQMENGMILSASDDDNSLRWYGVESSIAMRPKGNSLKNRSNFPDSSFMDSPSFNSRLDEVGNYKWLPVDSLPFYTKGRNILASYQINPLSFHVNTIISNAKIQIESVKKVNRTYASGYEANEININQIQVIETEIELNFSNNSVIQIDAEVMISDFPEDILISYVHFFIDNDESKILFIPVYGFNKNYIKFSFFANMATGTCRIVIPFDVNVTPNIKYKYIDNTSSIVKYREDILKTNNSDVFFNKDGSIYILFTDIEDESLDLCLLNKSGPSRIIRSLFQSINDEKISFLSCRTSSKDSSLIVMFQINECILIKTIYLSDVINSEFDLMPPINNPSSYAFADIKESSGNSIKVLSLNPKMYAELQKQISGIDIKNEIMANKERSNEAYFVHGDLTSQYSRNIYIEGNASLPLQSRQSSFNLLLLNGESTTISLNYLLDDNECFICRIKDCSSYAKYNKLNNTEKFSFEISDDGSIILFFVKDGNVFIKKGGAKSSFYDIFHGSVKFEDTLYEDYGLIAMRPIKYLIDSIGSTYKYNEAHGIVTSTDIGVCPEIESVSSVYSPLQNTLYVFYVVDGCIIYQYFDNFSLNAKNFINSMFTDNSGCITDDNKQISLIDFRNQIDEKSIFSCKNLPVYLCGTLDSGLKAAFKEDFEKGVSGYSNFKNRKSYILNPYQPLDLDNFNYSISPISPTSLVQRDGSIRVYIKDENGYLRGFSINGYNVMSDTSINII